MLKMLVCGLMNNNNDMYIYPLLYPGLALFAKLQCSSYNGAAFMPQTVPCCKIGVK